MPSKSPPNHPPWDVTIGVATPRRFSTASSTPSTPNVPAFPPLDQSRSHQLNRGQRSRPSHHRPPSPRTVLAPIGASLRSPQHQQKPQYGNPTGHGNAHNRNKRRRIADEPPQPDPNQAPPPPVVPLPGSISLYTPVSAGGNGGSNFASPLPSPRFPPSPNTLPSIYAPPTVPSPHPSHPPIQPSNARYATASSLSHIVAQIFNVVQDLNDMLERPPAPPNGQPPASPAKNTAADMPTLDAIGHCLETVYFRLLNQRDYISSRPPPPHPSAPSSASNDDEPSAAYAARLSEVQHKLTKATVEHDLLKAEHGKLQRDLTRSKLRAETLSKQIPDLKDEAENLANDKEQLLGNMEALQDSITELRQERDEARQDLRGTGGQWSVILANATKIDRLRVRERLRWEEERVRLKQELEALQGVRLEKDKEKEELERLRGVLETPGKGSGGKGCPCGGGAMEIARARMQNQNLGRRIEELERVVESSRTDAREMARVAERIVKMGQEVGREKAR